MSIRPPEKFPTPPEIISTRHLKKFPTSPEKYHLYRKNLTPPEIILTPLKFLNSHPENFSTLPPKNFTTHPPPQNFSTPPRKFLNPPWKYVNPTRKNIDPKNMLRGTPPPNIPLFLFLSISFPSLFRKKSENFFFGGGGGWGLNPLNHPP